jgi:hypothetical protein
MANEDEVFRLFETNASWESMERAHMGGGGLRVPGGQKQTRFDADERIHNRPGPCDCQEIMAEWRQSESPITKDQSHLAQMQCYDYVTGYTHGLGADTLAKFAAAHNKPLTGGRLPDKHGQPHGHVETRFIKPPPGASGIPPAPRREELPGTPLNRQNAFVVGPLPSPKIMSGAPLERHGAFVDRGKKRSRGDEDDGVNAGAKRSRRCEECNRKFP